MKLIMTVLSRRETKPLAAIGYQRLAGMAFTTAAVPYGAVKMGQLIYDVSNEELGTQKICSTMV